MQTAMTGLTDKEAADRAATGKVNVTIKKGQRTVGQIVRAHTLTYFNFINIVLGVLIFLTGQYKNLLFLGVIIFNSAIGIVQELRVKQLIDKLTVITASKATVIRSGNDKEIPIDQIVVDDLVHLSVGDQIVTDGKVMKSEGLEVNESMLTGESIPVHKNYGDSLYSGSFIVAGTGLEKVEKVGNECYAAQIVEKASVKHRASSEMQLTIGRIIKVVSIAIIPLGLLLYRSQVHASPTDIANAIVRTCSGVLSMIPEGLVLLTSVSFIIGVGRLAMKNALVQEMESIEALARVTVLCTDKTGTITTGNLQVTETIPLADMDEDHIREVMAAMNGAFSDVNVTQDALIKYFGKKNDWPISDSIPFSSARKFRAAAFGDNGSYALGAPEFLVKDNQKILDMIDDYSDQGYRVLLLGKCAAISSADDSVSSVKPVAAIVISDIIKTDAAETFKYFADAKVAVKVISGDNPRTVSAVAVKAGVENGDKYIDATTLPNTLPELQKVISNYTVFGRVKPEQKQLFVKAWQANGETVGMVGDGVNDVLAIKDADCGIAMANGSEAAKQSAHIVLLNSNFASMQDIVKEGRTIIANIERVSSLYLTKTIYASIMCLIFILLKTDYPFTTLQIGLINVTAIGIPSFLLTFEQKEKVYIGGFLNHVLRVAVPSAFTMVVMMMVVQILRFAFGWNMEIYATFSIMLGGLVGMLVVLQVLWPMNPYHCFIFGSGAGVFILAIIFLPHFYDMAPIGMWWSLLLIPLGALTLWLIVEFSKLANRFTDWFLAEQKRVRAIRKKRPPEEPKKPKYYQ
jgi:cation-transporting ATPase E